MRPWNNLKTTKMYKAFDSYTHHHKTNHTNPDTYTPWHRNTKSRINQITQRYIQSHSNTYTLTQIDTSKVPTITHTETHRNLTHSHIQTHSHPQTDTQVKQCDWDEVQVFCKFFALKIICYCVSVQSVSHLWSFVNGNNKTNNKSPSGCRSHNTSKKLQPNRVGVENLLKVPVAWQGIGTLSRRRD